MSIQTKETKQVLELKESIILARYYGDNSIMAHVSNDVENDAEAARELFAERYKNYIPKVKIEEALENNTDLDRDTIIEYALKIQLDLLKQD